MTEINYERLADALLTRHKTVPSSTPTGVYGHGSGGLFNHPALERPLFSAMPLPLSGLQSLLPVYPSTTTNPLYGIITGQTATSGSEPDGVCDDPPVHGVLKLCEHSFPFGRQSRQTKVYSIDRFGERLNRGEHFDLQMYGGMPPSNAPAIPDPSSFAQSVNSDIAKELFQFAVGWSRDFAREFYTGNPTNNTANGGRQYFYGLDYLINTGYRDAVTGMACIAADSKIVDFGSVVVNTNGTLVVQYITAIYHYLQRLARQVGLDPVTWNIVMPAELFYAITSIWPCAYLTTGCQAIGNNSQQQVDAGDITSMRDQMRTGKYLMIDGVRVSVVEDDAITVTESGGVSLSQIYFVPMTVLGRMPVTYLEYFDYDAPNGTMEAARMFASDGMFYTSDGGAFLWHKKPPTNLCVQMVAYTRPRLLLLTPYLAARLYNVGYTTLIHERDWDTSGTYFYNGGKTVGDTFPFYSPRA